MDIELIKNKVLFAYSKFRINPSVRVGLYEQIASFIDDGVPLDTIIRKLGSEYMRRGFDPRGFMLAGVSSDIESGRSLSESLIPWAPASEIMLLKSGEESGDLSSAFKQVCYATSASSGMLSAIMVALAYPVVLMTMLVMIIALFSLYAVPTLAMIKDPADWPSASQGLYHLSQFVDQKWWVILSLVFGFGFFYQWSSKNLTGSARNFLDKLPPWSIYKSFQSSVFLISVAAMMRAGKPVYDAISDLNKISDPYLSSHVLKIMNKLQDGFSIGSSFSQGFLGRETETSINVYSETSNIEGAMSKIGTRAIDASIASIKKIAAALNLLCMAAIAGFIFWGYYSFAILTQSMSQ